MVEDLNYSDPIGDSKAMHPDLPGLPHGYHAVMLHAQRLLGLSASKTGFGKSIMARIADRFRTR